MGISDRTTVPPSFPADTQWFFSESRRAFRAGLQTEPLFPDRIGIIMAAGAATRFRPLTASRNSALSGELSNPEEFSVVSWNKAALPIVGRSIVSHAIEDLVSAGFRYIVINVSKRHSADSVIRAVEEAVKQQPLATVGFLAEETPSGTLGGVAKMLKYVRSIREIPDDTDIAIFSGDILTNQPSGEILALHRRTESAFTLMLNPVPEHTKDQFGTVEIDGSGRILRFHEKIASSPSNLNNSSRYIANYGFLSKWLDRVTPIPEDKRRHLDPDCFFDFGLHLFTRHLEEMQQAGFQGFVSHRSWADLGRISDFHEINLQVLQSENLTVVEEGASVAGDCRLAGNYHVQKGAEIRGGASVRNSVVGSGWVVDGAELEGTLLMPMPRSIMSYGIRPGVRLKSCVVGCGTVDASHENMVIASNGEKLVFKDLLAEPSTVRALPKFFETEELP